MTLSLFPPSRASRNQYIYGFAMTSALLVPRLELEQTIFTLGKLSEIQLFSLTVWRCHCTLYSAA